MTAGALRFWSVILGLALAALALAGWSQAWFSVSLTGQFSQHPVLEVGGDASAPAVVALALASAATVAAMTISGTIFRSILAILLTALAGCIVLSCAVALADPSSAVSSAITDATGLAGESATGRQIGSLTTTAWPFVSMGAGVLLALVSIAILLTGRFWPASGRRYEPVRLEPAERLSNAAKNSSVDDWDDLSAGSDPTSG